MPVTQGVAQPMTIGGLSHQKISALKAGQTIGPIPCSFTGCAHADGTIVLVATGGQGDQKIRCCLKHAENGKVKIEPKQA
jgi:hypothetical protein